MVLSLFSVWLSACDEATSAGDGGPTPDNDGSVDAAADGENAEEFEAHAEVEPNSGTPFTEVNALAVGWDMSGTIGDVGDADVFLLPTEAGHIYRLELTAPAGSDLDGVLTVMDSGRHDEAPGDDFVKVSKEPGGASAVLEFVAFGAGHYVIVRDNRNLGAATVGGSTYTYTLRVKEVPVADRVARMLTFPSSFDDTLEDAGGVRLYAFNVDQGTDIEIDLDARQLEPASDIDARMYVWSKATGAWGARNDDDAGTEDSFLAAPLPIGGDLYLLVENVESTKAVADLRYHLTASLPN